MVHNGFSAGTLPRILMEKRKVLPGPPSWTWWSLLGGESSAPGPAVFGTRNLREC